MANVFGIVTQVKKGRVHFKSFKGVKASFKPDTTTGFKSGKMVSYDTKTNKYKLYKKR